MEEKKEIIIVHTKETATSKKIQFDEFWNQISNIFLGDLQGMGVRIERAHSWTVRGASTRDRQKDDRSP